MDDLAAARARVSQVGSHARELGTELFTQPVLVPADVASEALQMGPALAVADQPSTEFVAATEDVGRWVGEYWSVGGVRRLVVKNIGSLRWGRAVAAESSSPVGGRWTVKVIGPEDRLAMLPAPRELDKVHSWCVPQCLFDQIDRLALQAESASWASHVRNQLHAVTDREQLDGDDVQPILGDLSDLANDALRLADQTENDRLRVELLRAHWGLARRLDCWGAMHEKRVASRVQGRVAARGSLAPYLAGIQNQAPEVSEITSLSNELEKYETSRDPRIARAIAQKHDTLKSSTNSVDRTLSEAVEEHYRNANIRVAITAEMLNRLAGEKHTESQKVHERIAGTYVRGQSNVNSESRVLLDPSADEWQLELNAKGVVESNTLADGGPVQFRSRGTTDFSAHKTIVVNDKGVQLRRSDVNASCSNRLIAVTTDYDWVPIFGGYARDRAIGEYQARQGRLRSQIESRVEAQAREKLDEHTRDAVDQIRQQTYDRFASQLDQFGIKLTPVEMKTTTERLVARVRVAGDKQLGSHTPRPRALSESLASAQIHETALTNLAITLGLDGKRFTAPELQKMLREKFSQVASKTPIETRKDTVFQFAPEDSVQVHINDGRLELTISFASIEFQGDSMNGVAVHAFYVPKVEGLNAELVRDGSLGIEGRFSSTDRARLHNLFNRVLPPERHLPIVRAENPKDKRFDGLMITQLVLEDGWMGLAVGPVSSERVAERSRSLK